MPAAIRSAFKKCLHFSCPGRKLRAKDVLPAPLGPAMISICLALHVDPVALCPRFASCEVLVKAARLYGWQVQDAPPGLEQPPCLVVALVNDRVRTIIYNGVACAFSCARWALS